MVCRGLGLVYAQEDSWHELNAYIKELKGLEKYSEATEVAKVALEVAENTFVPTLSIQ